MAISQGEERVIQTAINNQNSANIQSAENIVNNKKFFGPKLEKLTEAINKASQSSGVLSKVIIVVAIVGTIITALQWYGTQVQEYDFTQYNDKQLKCIIALTKDQNKIMIDAAIELCLRRS